MLAGNNSAPAQTIIEFSNRNQDFAAALKSQLQQLRQRLFNDPLPCESPVADNDPKGILEWPGLEAIVAKTHFDLTDALEQVRAIHDRL